jgi:superfamily II DNA or RNA helicase
VKLRRYQSDAENSTMEAWADGCRSALGVMPTGTGKTIVFASLIRRKFPKRALIVAHRQELIWQARDKIKKVTGLNVDVEMGEYKSRTDGDMFHPKASVIVSTVQTLTSGGDGSGRLLKFDPVDFGLLVIDEAHHATSPSYRKVIDYFLNGNSKLVVIGVTATPDRADEEALGQIFDQVAFNYEILDAIKDGWLVPIEQQMVSVSGLDFSSVRTTAGDLNGADLEKIMIAEKNLHGIASATIDIIGTRRGIGFSSSVNHARMLSEIFNRHRTGMSNWVCGGTDKDERKKIITDFASGKIQWLWNCGVFTEGFDDSGVEIISMARPTKSRSLYAQMCGRATRPHESIAHSLDQNIAALRRHQILKSVKPSCLIIDFVGNSGKHKLMTSADILGGNISEQAVENAKIEARRSGKPMRMDKVIEDEEKKLEEQKRRRLEAEARKARLVGKATYSTRKIDPFDVLQIKPVAERGWDSGKTFTEKQSEKLRKMGVDPAATDYARGQQLLHIYYQRIADGKCTIKQAATLEKFGYSKTEASNMSFDGASEAITAIAQNGWRRPANFVPKVTVKAAGETVSIESGEVPF